MVIPLVTTVARPGDQPVGLAFESPTLIAIANYADADLVQFDTPSALLINFFVNGVMFDGPYGMTIDAAGNLYVAEFQGNRIDKIDAMGSGTILAGNGLPTFVDGQGLSAGFNSPSGVVADSAGNIYVADFGNDRIRKIDPSGNVTTVAGSGQQGDLDGPSETAEFHGPFGLAIGPDGSLYTGDRYGFRVRRIDPSGNVTTLAGNGTQGFVDGTGGPNGTAEFAEPAGMVLDAAGNLIVADQSNNRIRLVDPSGNVSTLAGNGQIGLVDGTEGPNGMAEFNAPWGVALDPSGNVYVTDTGNGALRLVQR